MSLINIPSKVLLKFVRNILSIRVAELSVMLVGLSMLIKGNAWYCYIIVML